MHFKIIFLMKRNISCTLSDKILVGQNISSDKIFDTEPIVWQFCLIFASLLYWNMGQNFRRTKYFVRQNFRHQVEISTILSDEFLSNKVIQKIHYGNVLTKSPGAYLNFLRSRVSAYWRGRLYHCYDFISNSVIEYSNFCTWYHLHVFLSRR